MEESPAFAIVPVDHFRGLGKPNAIVRPLRHNREVIEGQHIINLHPDYKLIHDLEAQIIRNNTIHSNKNKSDSNNNTTFTSNTATAVPIKRTERGRPNEFTKELDAKLRRLQNDSSKRSSKNVGQSRDKLPLSGNMELPFPPRTCFGVGFTRINACLSTAYHLWLSICMS